MFLFHSSRSEVDPNSAWTGYCFFPLTASFYPRLYQRANSEPVWIPAEISVNRHIDNKSLTFAEKKEKLIENPIKQMKLSQKVVGHKKLSLTLQAGVYKSSLHQAKHRPLLNRLLNPCWAHLKLKETRWKHDSTKVSDKTIKGWQKLCPCLIFVLEERKLKCNLCMKA